MDSIRESIIPVPVELVKESCGISLDMGGSVLKALYRTEQNLLDAEAAEDGNGYLTQLSVSRDRVKDAIEYIRGRACISKHVSGLTTIHTTGTGSLLASKYLADTLNIKIESESEFECVVRAFNYLASKMPSKDFLLPRTLITPEKTIAKSQRYLSLFGAIFEPSIATEGLSGAVEETVVTAFTDITMDPELPLSQAFNDLYPCILAMFGSAMALFKINADGSSSLIDGTSSGGRNLLGLGKLLTGASTFDDLLELAAGGDSHNIHVYGDDMLHNYSELLPESSTNGHQADANPLYTNMDCLSEIMVYCFGKCVNHKIEDFRKQDIARALLDQLIVNTMQIVSTNCRLYDIHRVYFCGSFFNSELTRTLTTSELFHRNFISISIKQLSKPIQFDFIKAGSHLGALGALISHYEKFNKSQKQD